MKTFIKLLILFCSLENRAHLALAVILSTFVGLVISLFFILDHSRRAKARKKALLNNQSKRSGDNTSNSGDSDVDPEMCSGDGEGSY